MKRWIAIGILAVLCLGQLFILIDTNDRLEWTAARLNSVQADLASAEAELTSLQTELTSTKTELTSAQMEAALTEAKLVPLQTELEATKEELSDLRISYDGLKAGHGYTIKDPTYREAMSFIQEDKTDKRPFIEGKYECRHFAMDVCNNAEEKGIRCAFAYIGRRDGAHAIVAFDTIDKGLIFIEPQGDDVVKPVIGKRYYKCVIPKPGYYYEKPDFDDTIEEILVIW